MNVMEVVGWCTTLLVLGFFAMLLTAAWDEDRRKAKAAHFDRHCASAGVVDARASVSFWAWS